MRSVEMKYICSGYCLQKNAQSDIIRIYNEDGNLEADPMLNLYGSLKDKDLLETLKAF